MITFTAKHIAYAISSYVVPFRDELDGLPVEARGGHQGRHHRRGQGCHGHHEAEHPGRQLQGRGAAVRQRQQPGADAESGQRQSRY